METPRPNPEKLLERVDAEERKAKQGKLKIYLGAAPGVGKTHKMLHDAHDQRSKGLDVVVGIAESHGRKEIDIMLKDLEILPKQLVPYHGKQLSEFDIDAALKRSPGLILVDEMAHANVPGLRHSKRWQDIKELLNRGIDVYTTLNVQHIESLNDDVSQIIHAPIKETVPDSMLEMADIIELIDIPPEELLKRLQEGKVYIPSQAHIAADHFFRKGNLTALRELALRTTAEMVGAQVLLYRQGQGIRHIWPTREKILVCIGPGPASLKLLRAARRMATCLQADWMAVFVDTPTIQASEEKHKSAIQNLRLAEQLGAETRVLAGLDIVKEIMNFARERNVTQIMIWKHVRTRWRNLFFRDLADEFVRNSGEIDVHITTGSIAKEREAKSTAPIKSVLWRLYGISLGIISLATLIDFSLYPYLASSNLIMVYLLGVTIISLFGETALSLLASILSVLCYDFFFIPPFYSFAITDIQYFFTLLVMLIVTQVISHLTILTRRRTTMARFAEHQTSALYTLSRQLASARGVDILLSIATRYISEIFDSEVLALLPEKHHLVIRKISKTDPDIDAKEYSIAQWVYDFGQPAGLGTETLSYSDALYIPLLASKGPIGVLRIKPKLKRLFSPEQSRLLEACAHQIAMALEVERRLEKSK